MSQVLVQLQEVTVRRGEQRVGPFTFELCVGDAWLLTGPNGGGKSTLLGLLAGTLSPASGERRYFLDGQWRTSAVRARRALATVSPDQEAWFLTRDWVQTVQDVLLAAWEGDTLRLWEPDAAALARLSEVVDLTGVAPLLQRDFRTLSHGQRRRVLLARALMPHPLALLLDEFTDGLSPAARAELGALLEQVAARGVALVLATHHPREAPALAWRTLELGGAGEATPEAARARRLPTPAAPVLGSPLVTLDQVSVYRNGHHALGPLSWQWREGQHWLVTGANGAGKSTLARLVAGDFFPARGGTVQRHFLPRDLLSERRRHIGIVGAELGIRGRRGWTGEQVIASAFGGTEGFAEPVTPEQQQRVEQVAADLGVLPLLARSADTLSQGQLGRLLLARAVVHRPRLLILDEGLNFLDRSAQRRLQALLPDLMAGGTHLMVIAHRDSDVVPGLTDHLQLEAGQVVGAQMKPLGRV
ncbi:ATP-binding cassette domain-containing protein [Deinococcus sonorensis]|uniref:ATP-binding cassette domain-containing protein n=2 Tax=Deinococcus sonorensis TaxID=309891 RepID=A0AAU7U7W5_9DEIO